MVSSSSKQTTASKNDISAREEQELSTALDDANSGKEAFNKTQRRLRIHLRNGGKSGITSQFGRPEIFEALDKLENEDHNDVQERQQVVSDAVRPILVQFCLAMRIKAFARQTQEQSVSSPDGRMQWRRTVTRHVALEQVQELSGSVHMNADDRRAAELACMHEVQPSKINEVLAWVNRAGENFALTASYWLHVQEARILRRL